MPRMTKRTNKQGQGLLEYALILSLIAVVLIASLSPIGNAVNGLFSSSQTKIDQGKNVFAP